MIYLKRFLIMIGLVLAASSANGQSITAVPANTFLSSLGMNTHIDQGVSGSSYVAPLQYLGVRNIRSGAGNLSELQSVHTQTGVLIDIFTNGDLAGIQSVGQSLASSGALLSLEGPNEPNNFPFTYNGQLGGGQGDWTPVANYQRDLYSAIKAGPLSSYPVFGVSEDGGEVNNVGLQFTTIPTGAGTLFPDGTKFSDYVNIHNYVSSTQNFYGDNMAWFAADPLHIPVWDGLHTEVGVTWYGNFQGYTDTQLPTVPKVTTETGWDSVAFGARVQGVVLVNNYLAQFKRGWKYTFIYQTRDGEGGSGNQGVFNSDSTPKLAATYIHNLTTILADTATFTPGQLSYTIPNEPVTVHDLLLQKANGKYELVVWGESASGSNNVTVNFGSSQGTVNVYDITSGTTPIQTLTNVTSVPLTMTDHAFIIETSGGSGVSSCGSTLIAPSSGSLTTSAGTWTFGGAANGSNYTILLNGQPAAGGVATQLEVANGGQLYALNNAGWFVYNGTGWTQVSGSPPACTSACGSTLIAPSSGSLVTNAGTWTFGSAANGSNYTILLNGQPASGGVATELEVANSGQLYALNNAGWFLYNNGTWSSSGTPPACGSAQMIDDTDPSVIYSSPNSSVGSGWILGSNSNDFNSTGHYTNYCVNPPQTQAPITGPMAVENFNGTAITLIGQMGPNYGIASYGIDGVTLGTFNAFHSATEIYGQTLVNVTGLSPGSHVLTYAVTCNTTGSDFYQVIDAYNITGTPLSPSQGTVGGWNQVTTTGSWSSTTSNTNLSGGQLWSGAAGATISWTFTGSLIEVFGRPDVGDGLFNVTIDGVQVATNVDEHYGVADNDALTGYLIYAKKLSSGGTHTITLTVTGTSDSYNGAESSGLRNLLQFDEFLAFP